MKNLAALISGILFGLGLALSGMTDTSKMIGFLDITGRWDPDLIWVMASAVLVSVGFTPLILRRARPLLAAGFSVPATSGIDRQLISATPILFAYERPVTHATDCAQLFNDLSLEICNDGDGRLLSLCQVPLQDTDAACKTLSRAMAEGHVGVQIGNHVGERNLDDEGLVTFLQHCAAEGAAVLVHPWDMTAADRTARYMMGWTVGMPAETQLGIVSMILGGAFDRLPEDLRLCFAHGGGSFAFLLGRLDNAWRRRDIVRGNSTDLPSSYVSRFYVDSAVFDPTALRFLVDVMGEDRVMLGSDYPFPLGEEVIGDLIRTADGFSDEARSKLLGRNALQFLGLAE